MKIAIVYYSKHHGNTKKLVDAIAAENEVTLIDVTQTPKADLTGYDLIGFASGIYYQKYSEKILTFADDCLPQKKKVFYIHTCGIKRKNYTAAIDKIARLRHAEILGSYACKGYDTFGPFKLVGGIAKKHPNEEDIKGAVAFFNTVKGKCENQ